MKKYGGIKGKLDKLVGDFYRSRSCEYCGSKSNINFAHIKSRRYLTTRWDKNNCLSLCAKCHLHFHAHPDLFIRWIEKTWPDRIDKLNFALKNLNTITKKDLEDLLTHLTSELTQKRRQ